MTFLKRSLFILFLSTFIHISTGWTAVFEVTNTANDGPGSFRQALIDANNNAGPDSICFLIPETDAGFDGTVWTIQPTEELPDIEDDSTLVYGHTQGLYIRDTNPDGPEIFLDGRLAENADGFDLESNYNEISGLIISGFAYDGINIIWDSDYNWIYGNFIGTNAAGNDTLGNGIFGINIHINCEHNRIGGNEESQGNLISGNKSTGVYITGNQNIVTGNRIGTNANGSEALPNKKSGIKLLDCNFNEIGQDNLISGNIDHGIYLSNADSNIVAGNKIGTDFTGTLSVPNTDHGIYNYRSAGNLFGGLNKEESNLISGNEDFGIYLSGTESVGNTIQGNRIGTNSSVEEALPNKTGISVSRAKINMIGGREPAAANIISGNNLYGIQISSTNADSNVVKGNKIGTNITEGIKIPNGNDGINIKSGAQYNNIGPDNTIAYNGDQGIYISGSSTHYNTIYKNAIYNNTDKGIDLYGTTNQNTAAPVITGKGSVLGTSFPNATIQIYSDSTDEGRIYEGFCIADAAGNFTWEGEATGPFVTATATTSEGSTSEFSAPFRYKAEPIVVTNTMDDGEGSLRNAITLTNEYAGPDTIHFNIPDTDDGFDGTAWMIQPLSELPSIEDDYTIINGFSQSKNQGNTNEEGPEIFLNGSLTEHADGLNIRSSNNEVSGLIVSGFDNVGINIWNDGSSNRIYGNYIGTTADGNDILSNDGYGIHVHSSCNSNTIGGPESIHQNVISGNGNNGIYMSSSKHNTILNNRIGTDRTGQKALTNKDQGIMLANCAQINIGPDNIISGNTGNGIYIATSDSISIIKNRIGTNLSGSSAILNGGNGISLYNVRYHQIGGSAASEGNLISGNTLSGITINGENSRYNTIQGNLIGTNISASDTLPNHYNGIFISNARQTLIGGDEEKANIISGNIDNGIYIRYAGADSNVISHNCIGTNLAGNVALPNTKDGINIMSGASLNHIGPDNIISCNERYGVYISGSPSKFNTITQNSIYKNISEGIYLWGDTNQNVEAPEITGTGSIIGTTFPEAFIEIFSDSTEEGRWYEGTCQADADGNFVWNGNPRGPFVTATATNDSGSTSEFSDPFRYTYEPIVVINTADDGKGSLRWAIEEANKNQGTDTIFFDIPQTDANFDGTVWTIRPQSTLPWIEDDHTIMDGFSQTKNQSDTNPDGPEIMILGYDAGDYNNCFSLSGDHCIISGFIISGFDGNGIYLRDSNGSSIFGNYIGTTSTGSDTIPNQIGIYLNDSNRNIIGNAFSDMVNLISGNKHGIYITYSDSNQVCGNKIGTDISGSSAMGNTGYGIDVQFSSYNHFGGVLGNERNIISGNEQDGIRITSESSYNKIIGNYIGTDSSGTKAIGNGWRGITIYRQYCKYNQIGGTEKQSRNIISGNSGNGIQFGSETDSNLVANNYIGTDKTGLQAIPNTDNGIRLAYGSSHNFIGPDNLISGNLDSGIDIFSAETDSNLIVGNWIGLNATGQDTIPNGKYGIKMNDKTQYNLIGGESIKDRNIISGNRRDGIYIYNDSTRYNWITNNYIGTDTSGTLSLGNGKNGIEINSSDNIIGPDNKIYYNTDHGIEINDTLAQRITITENSIYSNNKQGIFIFESGNNNIEPPVIISVNDVTGTTLPNSMIEIFSDSTDEGRIYETTVTSDGDGNFTWSGTPSGPFVTATVTDGNGNTSVFSEAVELNPTPVEETDFVKIRAFSLHQNHPNPFNPQTTIAYDLMESADVTLIIYDLLGREVWQNDIGIQNTGQHQLVWHGQNQQGSQVATGIYFYQIQVTEAASGNLLYQNIRKMIFMK